MSLWILAILRREWAPTGYWLPNGAYSPRRRARPSDGSLSPRRRPVSSSPLSSNHRCPTSSRAAPVRRAGAGVSLAHRLRRGHRLLARHGARRDRRAGSTPRGPSWAIVSIERRDGQHLTHRRGASARTGPRRAARPAVRPHPCLASTLRRPSSGAGPGNGPGIVAAHDAQDQCPHLGPARTGSRRGVVVSPFP